MDYDPTIFNTFVPSLSVAASGRVTHGRLQCAATFTPTQIDSTTLVTPHAAGIAFAPCCARTASRFLLHIQIEEENIINISDFLTDVE